MAYTCYNCFKQKTTGGVCPFCGYDGSGDTTKYPLALNLYELDVLHDTESYSKKIKDFCMQNREKTVPAAWIREQFNGNTDATVANFLGEQMERALQENQ